MCLAKAYLNKWGDEPVLQDIAHMRLHGEHVDFSLEKVVSSLFQQPGKVEHVEEPTEGYFRNAGFTKMVAGKRATDLEK